MGETSAANRKDVRWRRKEVVVENAAIRELEALRLAAKASRSIATLELRQKAIVGEINERKKRLRRLIAGIESQEQMGTLPLHGLESISIAEEDMALVLDPLRRL